MNVLMAVQTLPGYAGDATFDATPAALPVGPYAVVTELGTGTTATYQKEPGGVSPRVRTVTTLVTLYGPANPPPGSGLADLRMAFEAAQALADDLTHTLSGRPVAGVQTGPDLPPRRDPGTGRSYAAVRFTLTYRTGVTLT